MGAFIFYQSRLSLKLPEGAQREGLSGFINKMGGFLSLLKHDTYLLLQVYFCTVNFRLVMNLHWRIHNKQWFMGILLPNTWILRQD